jgi:precorrin-2/cobalt-factor-2 C20-methyltransferase
MSQSLQGIFFGIGVGPGEPGLFPVIAWQALQSCKVLYAPRSEEARFSAALHSLKGFSLEGKEIKEIEFKMNPDRSILKEHYVHLADQILNDLQSGRNVAYLTIGDSLTYSTYIYTLRSVLKKNPRIKYRTFPGIPSYCAVAAALDYPLGEAKERVLILPCPERMEELQRAIEENDIVILMKIGKRLGEVIKLLRILHIEEHCVLGSRMGFSDQKTWSSLVQLEEKDFHSAGYLSTLLIRRRYSEERIFQ